MPETFSPPVEAVLFDLDGTLLDTLNDLANSGNAVLENHGMPAHPIEKFKTFIGDGMEQLVRRIFPEGHKPETDEEIATILTEYKGEYEKRWKATSVPFLGINELLDFTRDAGLKIGVLSNKSHLFTVKCVEEFFPDWEWHVVFGQRDGVPKKPNPAGAVEAAGLMGAAPEACLFVGDSDVDMQTGKNAGMTAIGVGWGFRSAEELRENGADFVVDSASEIREIIEKSR